MAARIYGDVPGNKCTCGGKYSKRTPHPDDKDIEVPKCDTCDKYPPLFQIDADALDINGAKIRIKIRHTQNGERLDRMSRVTYTLERAMSEIKEGTFDIRKYVSTDTRESFIFKNYIQVYLSHHRKRLERGEITPKGLLDKEGLIRRELMPFFSDLEVQNITHSRIKKFQDSYTSKLRTRDLALGELKCILNQSVRDGLLQVAPKFDPIPRSKQRDEIITRDLVEATIRTITKEIYRDMYRLLLIYPIRPGELRAITWKNVDFTKGLIIICQHFSNGTLIDGRKSIKKDKKEHSIIYPMTEEAREILQRYRSAQITSLKSFVFLSKSGKEVSEDALWESWKVARNKVGHKFAPYECRHVSASALYEKTGGDLIKMKRAGGWTNTSTLERYVRDTSDMKDLF